MKNTFYLFYLFLINSPSFAYYNANVTVNMMTEKNFYLPNSQDYHVSYTTVKDSSPHTVRTFSGKTGKWRTYAQHYRIFYLEAIFGTPNDLESPYCTIPTNDKYYISPNESYELTVTATGWENKQINLLSCDWKFVKN
jgi:hypothetical protein